MSRKWKVRKRAGAGEADALDRVGAIYAKGGRMSPVTSPLRFMPGVHMT